MLEAALTHAERGWAVIPIDVEGKKPLVEWGHYADTGRHPTEDEITRWWGRWPYAHIGVITGPLSGIVVVDTDNEDAAIVAEKAGLTRTPVSVQTKKGRHFYWAFPPGTDWIKNRVGSATSDGEWPRQNGLDLRGSKGYVLVPPSEGYSWAFGPGADLDDLPVYPGPDMGSCAARKSATIYNFEDFKYGDLDLSTVRARGSVWEETAALVEKVGKLPPGGSNGRDERVWRCLSELAAGGLRGEELIAEAHAFQQEYFTEPLAGTKTEQMAARVQAMEEKNHPERQPVPAVGGGCTTITTGDIARLRGEVGALRYYAEPVLPVGGSIVQVHGYSGHGKSMVVRHLCYAAAAGAARFGPFECMERPRVLYFDFENGRRNILRFLERCRRSFGDAGDHFHVWAPFAAGEDLSLRQQAGLERAGEYITRVRPDVVVFDTVRSAWAGLEENSAEAWAPVNEVAMRLRNAGINVILVHHSNKPGDNGISGREAGSGNQLTVLETQLKITQVFRDQATATNKGGLYDGNLSGSPMLKMSTAPVLRDDEQLEVCVELRYGKVREWSETHEPVSYLGFMSNMQTDHVRIVSPPTRKQQALRLAHPTGWNDWQGVRRPPLPAEEISVKLGVPARVVSEWIEEAFSPTMRRLAGHTQL